MEMSYRGGVPEVIGTFHGCSVTKMYSFLYDYFVFTLTGPGLENDLVSAQITVTRHVLEDGHLPKDRLIQEVLERLLDQYETVLEAQTAYQEACREAETLGDKFISSEGYEAWRRLPETMYEFTKALGETSGILKSWHAHNSAIDTFEGREEQ